MFHYDLFPRQRLNDGYSTRNSLVYVLSSYWSVVLISSFLFPTMDFEIWMNAGPQRNGKHIRGSERNKSASSGKSRYICDQLEFWPTWRQTQYFRPQTHLLMSDFWMSCAFYLLRHDFFDTLIKLKRGQVSFGTILYRFQICFNLLKIRNLQWSVNVFKQLHSFCV